MATVEHTECDCVPHLGPSHCHTCHDALNRIVPWVEAVPLHAAAAKRFAFISQLRAIADSLDQTGFPDTWVATLAGAAEDFELASQELETARHALSVQNPAIASVRKLLARKSHDLMDPELMDGWKLLDGMREDVSTETAWPDPSFDADSLPEQIEEAWQTLTCSEADYDGRSSDDFEAGYRAALGKTAEDDQ